MSNYTKITDFAAKDSMLTGNPLKEITGTAHDNEYNAISVAVATKVDTSGALGTPSSGTLTNCTGLPAAGVTGTALTAAAAVTVAQGGTGAATFTSGGLLVGNGASAIGIASAAQIVAAIGATAVTNATNASSSTTATTAATATVANGLKSATTTVAVSAATAPTSGQVLTATGDSAATWQTPSTTTFSSSAENIAGTVENKSVDPLGIREAFNCTGSAPVYACRAWVKFDGSNVASFVGGNVSSVTDLGTGLYRINFSTAMPDTSYSISGIAETTATYPSSLGVVGKTRGGTMTTSAIDIETRVLGGSPLLIDPANVFIQVFR